jgi:small-conductance mechanosensitive channel
VRASGNKRAVVLALTRLGWTGVAVGGGVLVVAAAELFLRRAFDDRARRFGVKRTLHFATVLVVLLVLAGIWHVFGGHIGLVVGLGAAGLGFALQNVIGAVVGWIGILVSGIFRIGDRISFAGVEGDVIDLTPLRTVIMEMGSPERILLEEVERASDSEGARRAMADMARRYPVPLTEVEPAVFVRATDNWWEISGRFIVPIRTVRTTKSDLTKRVGERLDAAGIEISSATSEQLVRFPEGLPRAEE